MGATGGYHGVPFLADYVFRDCLAGAKYGAPAYVSLDHAADAE